MELQLPLQKELKLLLILDMVLLVVQTKDLEVEEVIMVVIMLSLLQEVAHHLYLVLQDQMP